MFFCAAVAACGPEESSLPPVGSRAASPHAVEIRGTVTSQPKGTSLLVFAYSGAVDPLRVEPDSVSVVGPDGSFVLSELPAGVLQVIFLLDDANDGALDPGDPMARLADPDGYLRATQPGDRIVFDGIEVDPSTHIATAGSVTVERATPAPTPTAVQPGREQ